MRIGKVEVRDFRNFDRATVELGNGITVVHGPNGAGKTNLLEAVHFALAGGSCRTRNERELIAFGVGATRVEVDVATDAGTSTFAASIARNGERKFKVEGPASANGERPLVGVFLPERLDLIKGRRASAAPTSTASSPRSGRPGPSCAAASAGPWPSATRCSAESAPARHGPTSSPPGTAPSPSRRSP